MRTTCPECGHNFEVNDEQPKQPAFDKETPFDAKEVVDLDEDAVLAEAVEGDKDSSGKYLARELET